MFKCRVEAELHLVHMNAKYSDVAEAKTHPDGLAVVGIMLEVDEETTEMPPVLVVRKFSIIDCSFVTYG